MVSIAVYSPEATTPELVYLHQDRLTSFNMSDLGPVDAQLSTPEQDMPPPIPRMSSRRALRHPISPVQAHPVTGGSDTVRQGISRSSGSLSSNFSATSGKDFNRSTEELENTEVCDEQPPSYAKSVSRMSSCGTEPYQHFSQSSSCSDSPPEYTVDSPRSLLADPTNNFPMTTGETSMPQLSSLDLEADVRAKQSKWVYELQEMDLRPEYASTINPVSPTSACKTFHINQRGMNSVRLPFPSGELQVHITKLDGSIAYISSRVNKSTSNCVLYKPDYGSVMQTTYDKRIILTSLRDDRDDFEQFALDGKSMQRTRSFRLPGEDRQFEWQYISTRTGKSRREEQLVLFQKSVMSSAGSSNRATKVTNKDAQPIPRILARLIRSNEGSARAGHGGQLILEPGCEEMVPEEVVVATSLVMLKKEMDRLRAVQTGVIVAMFTL